MSCFKIGDRVEIDDMWVSTVHNMIRELKIGGVFEIDDIQSDGTYDYLRFKGQSIHANAMFFRPEIIESGFRLYEAN
jgi:hypothetical protein